MDQKELQQKIAEYYAKLSPEVQQLFSSMSWIETLKVIGDKYSLNDTQKEILGTETTLVLLGIIHPDEYEKELIKQLNISKENADKIIIEISDKILREIRPQLSDIFDNNAINLVEEASKEAGPAPLPPYKNNQPTVGPAVEKNPPANLPIAPKVAVEKKPEIKIPPKVEIPTPKVETKPIMNTESGIMQSVGIEMINEPEIKKSDEGEMTKKEDTLLEKSGINLVEENSLKEENILMNEETEKSALYGIEHPPKANDLIQDKLKGVVTNPATISNHSLPKNNSLDVSKQSTQHDPYREIV